MLPNLVTRMTLSRRLFMYPGSTHGIPEPRNRLVKSVSEMAWMDYYVRGIGNKFEWQQVLETLQEEREGTPPRAIFDGAGAP